MYGGNVMRIFMKTKTGRYDAQAEFDAETKETIVLTGSRVSPTVAQQEHFHSANAILKKRNKYVVDGVLTEDLKFRSLSAAACFVGGNSHNGLDDWKLEDGKKVRTFLERKE